MDWAAVAWLAVVVVPPLLLLARIKGHLRQSTEAIKDALSLMLPRVLLSCSIRTCTCFSNGAPGLMVGSSFLQRGQSAEEQKAILGG